MKVATSPHVHLQVGYGIAPFTVGPLLDSGVDPTTIYGVSAIVSVAMGFALLAVTRVRRPALRDVSDAS